MLVVGDSVKPSALNAAKWQVWIIAHRHWRLKSNLKDKIHRQALTCLLLGFLAPRGLNPLPYHPWTTCCHHAASTTVTCARLLQLPNYHHLERRAICNTCIRKIAGSFKASYLLFFICRADPHPHRSKRIQASSLHKLRVVRYAALTLR